MATKLQFFNQTQLSAQAVIESVDSTELQLSNGHGQERLTEEERWVNKLIYGNNLSVLKALYEDGLKESIDLVYIDPPFSINREFKSNKGKGVKQFSKKGKTAYSDTTVGSEYLSSLRKRLVLLRELLSNEGSIYLHIDKKVGAYVKLLMDNVFGRENHINTITRIKCNPKNFPRPAYGNYTDTILFYSKTGNHIWNDPRQSYPEDEIERRFPKVDDDGRRYTTTPLHAPGETENGATGQPWNGLEPPEGRHWRYPPEELTQLDEEGLIEWSSNGNPRKIRYADEAVEKGMKRQDLWEFKDPQYPDYPTEKNLDLLKVIVEASSNEESIVMDCYSGSGTTLLAAEELGRNWIGIDASKEAIKTSKERLENKEARFFLYEAT